MWLIFACAKGVPTPCTAYARSTAYAYWYLPKLLASFTANLAQHGGLCLCLHRCFFRGPPCPPFPRRALGSVQSLPLAVCAVAEVLRVFCVLVGAPPLPHWEPHVRLVAVRCATARAVRLRCAWGLVARLVLGGVSYAKG